MGITTEKGLGLRAQFKVWAVGDRGSGRALPHVTYVYMLYNYIRVYILQINSAATIIRQSSTISPNEGFT